MSSTSPPGCLLEPGGRVELGPFLDAENGRPARWQTLATLAWEGDRLVVRFACEDDDAWGTHDVRDAPLWTEEVVELFVAPGAEAPRRYFELELSPRGAVFDAVVESPFGDRRDLRVDPSWDCPGLVTGVERSGRRQGWLATISIPWAALADRPGVTEWRINLFRIERPRDGSPPEHSAWSPTFASPADFHRPARFGHLRLATRPKRPARAGSPRGRHAEPESS